MKKYFVQCILSVLLCWWFSTVIAQVSCSSGYSLLHLYTGYGKDYTVNSSSYVTAGINATSRPDGSYATVKHNSNVSNRGVITIDLSDNVPNQDTIYFVASGQDSYTCTWDVSVSSDGVNFSSTTGYSTTSSTLTTRTYIVNNASGARYVRFASSSSTKDLRLDAIYYHKKTCQAYCLSTAISYSGGNATDNPSDQTTTALNPNNALGAPDKSASSIDGSSSQELYLDLGTVVPYGTQIQLLMADDVSGSHAVFQVSGSLNDTTFSGTQSFTSKQVKPAYTDFYYNVTQGNGIRYLKITNSVSVKGDVDALSFQYPTYWGSDWINGYVFSDLNFNNVKDGGETGISGITVNLSKDLNHNGTFDAGDVVVQTTSTTTGGAYTFQITSLDTNYIVSVQASTLPTGNVLSGNNMQAIAFSTFNNTSCGNDFGYHICTGNCKPIAFDDYTVAILGTGNYLNVLFNDYDANNDINPDSLQVVAQPNNGSVVVSNGVLVYTPIATGYDTLSYRIADLSSPTSLWDTAIVVIFVSSVNYNACTDAAISHLYYIPAPEQDLRTAFGKIDCHTSTSLSDSMRTVISIKCPYPGVIIYYDQWEDGYESSILSPTQSTTQVWGDGDLYNGTAPGYPNDIIPAGGSIVLDNTMFDNPRNASQFYYDARDKIYSNTDIALSRIAWDKARGPLQAYSVDVYDMTRFGTSFNIPVGNYTGSTKDFQVTGAFIRAAYDNTSVSIDKNNDGIADTTVILSEGQSYFQSSGIMAGASITSSFPVGVDVFFGDSATCWNFKELNILPASFYGDTYYSPVPTTKSSDSAVAMFYNPLNRSITINWTTSAGSGSFAIGAKGVYRFPLGPNGYKFKSAGGESYVVNELIDAWSVDGTTYYASDYDWAFAPITEDRLTSFGAIAWAPGSLDGTKNGNPVWVMPVSNTTIYVKWDGNILGATGSTSPCGLKYDSTWTLAALNVKKLLDVDKDQSGLAVYNCNDVKMAIAWGEDPSLSGTGSPYIDVGTSVQPFCVTKNLLANDDYAVTTSGVPVTIKVLSNDTGFLATIDPTTLTTSGFLQPAHGTVSINANGTILYTPASGFSGMDTFVYHLCSTAAPVVCDEAIVVVKVSACPTSSKRNVISGQIYNDINKDGVKNDDGTGISPGKVYLYVDGNCNGTIDANELEDSVSVDASGSYQFLQYPQKIVADDFNDAYGNRTCANGSDGNTPWLSNWTDAGDASSGFCNNSYSVANTDVEIIKDPLGVGLRLKDKNKSATRSLNMSSATSAYLSFSYRRKSTTFASTDSLKVQMSTNGTSYTTIYTITGNGAIDANYIDVSNLDIVAYASSTTYLRFATGTNTTQTDADSIYIDNVRINFLKYNQCFIVRLDTTSTVSAGSYVTTAKQYSMTAYSGATCLTGYDFGIAKHSITISGTLYNDANGMSDNLVNGTPIDAPSGTTMYAYLVANNGKIAFKDTFNNGNGTYAFTKANINTTYTVIVTAQNISVGSSLSNAILPNKWSNTGETYGANNGAGSGNEGGTANSKITVITGASNVTGVNFGIQLPNAGVDKATCMYYGVNSVTMAASTTPGTWSAQNDNPGTATITSPSSTTTTITNFSDDGVYNFIWTNPYGSSDTAQVVITNPSAGIDFSVCGGSIGTLTGNYSSGTWTAKSGNPAGATLGSTVNGVASVNFINSASGTYYYIYTINGCADTVNLSLTPKPSAGSVTSTLNTCANSQGYVAQVNAGNPSPNSGVWSISSGPGTVNNPTNNVSTIGGLSKTGQSTTAIWVITDSRGCHDTATTVLSPSVMDTSMISKYSNSFCITCPVINGNKFDYFDMNGKLLASVTDSSDGIDIGQTDFCAKLNYPVSGDPSINNVPNLDTYIQGAGHIPQPYLPRYWNINATNDAPMIIDLYFTDEEVAALQGATLNNGNYYYFDSAPRLLVAAYPSTTDSLIPAGSQNGMVIQPTFTRVNGYWEVSFRIAQSATFYLYPTFWQGSPLPVELMSFNVTPMDDNIRLDWATASEENNLQFNIERSTDGVHFETIGVVQGKGNYKGVSTYTFNDVNVEAGVLYYYRLKQVDYSGRTTQSDMRKAMIDENGKLVISNFIPNPSQSYSVVRVMCSEHLDMTVRIFSLDGRFVREDVHSIDKGESEISVDVSLLPEGTYIVQFNSHQGTEVRKLVRIQ